MELEHSFTVPVGVEGAWKVLRDIERIAPCMPGATIDSVDSDDFTGRVKVKVGPMQITYKGDASFVEVDDTAHRAVIDARGRESRGSGTANAKITAHLAAEGEGTRVKVTTNLTVTGKPAQFGRGVMADVGEKLIGRFADCLATQFAAEDETIGVAAQDTSGATVAGAAVTPSDTDGDADAPDKTEGAAVPTDGQLAGAGVPASGATGTPVSRSSESSAFTSPAKPSEAAGAGPRGAPRPSEDAIDLFDVASAPVLKRLVPVAALAAVGLLVWWLRRA